MKDTTQVTLISSSVLSVVTLSNLDILLRCVLTAVTIGFVLWKWHKAMKRKGP